MDKQRKCHLLSLHEFFAWLRHALVSDLRCNDKPKVKAVVSQAPN